MVTSFAPSAAARDEAGAEKVDFAALYDAWFDEVVRWAGALGGPSADVDDIAQEVFLVAQRKLARFDGRNVAGWLYAIASRVVANHRRKAWVRRVLGLQRLDAVPTSAPSPVESAQHREDVKRAWDLLCRLSERRREAFILFEVEGYSGQEIADFLAIPVATVWTRLHHARRDFMALVASQRPERE